MRMMMISMGLVLVVVLIVVLMFAVIITVVLIFCLQKIWIKLKLCVQIEALDIQYFTDSGLTKITETDTCTRIYLN